MSIQLRLYKGIPPTSTEFVEPPFSGGGTAGSDPEMQFLDLLAPGLGLTLFSWVPAIPGLKAGIWNDSATQTGRQLQAQPNTNAIETFTFTAPTRSAGLYMIERLLDYGRAARDYHESDVYTPVQLQYTTDTGKDNWALIYNVQASFSAFDATKTADSPVDVEVTIERESFWRPIPFRWNPKTYTLLRRGYTQVISFFGDAPRPNGSNQWNVGNLTLNSGTGDYTSAIEDNIRMGEESFSTTPRNFIDIPADLIPGDAPADLQFTIDVPNPTSNTARILIAKSTMFNWSDQRYATGSLNGLTHTYSTSDAGINPSGAPANITTTQPVTADGFLNNVGTRAVAQHVFAAGAAGSNPVLQWVLRTFNFKGRYNVFLRHTCLANATDVQVYFTLAVGTTTVYTSMPRRLDTVIAGYRAGSMWLGELDMSIFDYPAIPAVVGDGAQTVIKGTILRLHFIKTAATTPTVLTWDVTLLPIDEGFVEIMPNVSGQITDNLLYDNTSYASSFNATGHAALYSGFTQAMTLGAPIKLTPNTRNRLIFYIQNNIGTFSPAQEYPVRINIVPRWSGLRP